MDGDAYLTLSYLLVGASISFGWGVAAGIFMERAQRCVHCNRRWASEHDHSRGRSAQ